MIEAKNVFIGFGKAAKTLAFKQAQKGESVVVIEKSDMMYGGTCINIACIPSKYLYEASKKPKVGDDKDNYQTAILSKSATIAKLRHSNLHKLSDQASVKILNASASFVDKNTLDIKYANGTTDQVKGERIFINTGATPIIPDIEGLKGDPHMVTSTELLDQKRMPSNLAIIGGGFIGMEFATTYGQFGSKVTVIDNHEKFMANMDEDVATSVKNSFNELGVEFVQGAKVTKVTNLGDQSQIDLSVNGDTVSIYADTILVSTGRRANVDGLNLDKAGVEYNQRGVVVNDTLQTNQPNIWAMGDVRGGEQFTFISLDDYRVVYSQLYGDKSKNLAEQANTPHTVFLNPPLSQIGIDEKTAKAEGIEYRVAKVPVAGMPKAHILGMPVGFYKALVGKDNQILGATILAPEAQEVINIISLAMHAHLPYQYLRDQIYAHPTMAEGLNDLFEGIGMD